MARIRFLKIDVRRALFILCNKKIFRLGIIYRKPRIEATLPKASGGTSDPVYKEVVVYIR